VSESDEPAVVPPKSGQCSKASRGNTGPKKKPCGEQYTNNDIGVTYNNWYHP